MAKEPHADVRNLMVNYLPTSVADEELYRLFSPFGELVDCRVVRDKMTGEPRGFGFVTYAAKESGEAAVGQMHGSLLHGRRIRVGVAKGIHSATITTYLEDKRAGRHTSAAFVPRLACPIASAESSIGTPPPSPPPGYQHAGPLAARPSAFLPQPLPVPVANPGYVLVPIPHHAPPPYVAIQPWNIPTQVPSIPAMNIFCMTPGFFGA